MAVPTLPLIGVTPSHVFFQTLEWMAFALVAVLLLAAFYSSTILLLVLCKRLFGSRNRSATPMRRANGPQAGCCCIWIETVLLSVGRSLCVNVFPALFKMHKTRSSPGNQMTREFMVFLDRKVESKFALVAAFCTIIYSIFATSTVMFIQYFPLVLSGECIEKDDQGRSVFCYINSSINQSLPVDCAEYNVTELRELHFKCYAISVPGFGIAVAAALGLAKAATLGITIIVKVTERFFEMTKKHSDNLEKCCCNRKIANTLYICSCLIALLLVVVAPYAIILLAHKFFSVIISVSAETLSYLVLPFFVCPSLGYIITKVNGHCKQGEYVSFAPDQRPPDPHDWDEESAVNYLKGEQGKGVIIGQARCHDCSVATMETEETHFRINTRYGTEDEAQV